MDKLAAVAGGKHEMRGLTNFISDIRATKDEEERRINKEMAHIRKQFKEQSSQKLDGYNRKKYVSKLLYMYLLGYEPDFGYMEAVRLLSGKRFTEKQIGYITLSVVLHEEHEMIPLIINSFRNDLESRVETHVCLALAAVCNIGGKGMAESLAPSVEKLIMSATTGPMIKKKAAMCLMRLYKRYPDIITPEIWATRIPEMLANEPELGVISGYISFLTFMTQTFPEHFDPLRKNVIEILARIIITRKYTRDYIYYKVANPWLQVKLIQLLQLYDPNVPLSKEEASQLNEILTRVVTSVDVVKTGTPNHKNAFNAVFFEAVRLIVHLAHDDKLLGSVVVILGQFLAEKLSNTRYLALEAMTKFAQVSPDAATLLQQHMKTVIEALEDPDISIRRRALDLLYGMCDHSNSTTVVGELIKYLHRLNVSVTADYAIREEIVLKVAILAEKYASRYKWYVDVILQLVAMAGDAMSDAIWYRAIKLITNHEDIQEYATDTAFKAVCSDLANETTVKVASYLVGEYGTLIADMPNSAPIRQFEVLQSKYSTVTEPTKAILLSTYVKFCNMFPELKQRVMPIFKLQAQQIDPELQQRSVEYFNLLALNDDPLLSKVCEVMPAYADIEEDVDDYTIPTTATMNQPASNRRSSMSARRRSISSAGSGSQPSSPSSSLTNIHAVANSPITQQTPPRQSSHHHVAQSPTSPTQHNHSHKSPSSSSSSVGHDSLIDVAELSGEDSTLSSSPQERYQGGMSPDAVSSRPNKARGQSVFADDVNKEFSSAVEAAKQHHAANSNGAIQLAPPPDQLEGATPEERAKAAFRRLLILNQGVLFEDETIQVGYKAEYQKGMGRMMLYFGNKASQPITSFSLVIPPVGFMAVQTPQKPSPIIDPGTQQKFLIQMACQTPFNDTFAQITMSFICGGKTLRQKMDLPITICKFVDGLELDGPKFFGMWAQINQAPAAFQDIFPSAQQPINVQMVQKLLSQGFNFQILAGLDPSPNNMVAAATFTCATLGQVVCLVRLEANLQANMFRLSIRTPSPAVTLALKKAFQSHLAKPVDH